MNQAAKIAFRVDASHQIGTGHVIRCLALTQELASRQAEIFFLSRDLPGNLLGLLESQPGIRVLRLPALPGHSPVSGPYPHSHWLGCSEENDLADSLAALRSANLSPDCLIVDHYALGAVWEKGLRATARQILAIDDLADRPHDADFLIDQNYSRDLNRYSNLVPSHCAQMLGPQYALLRPEFGELRARAPSPQKSRKLLVFFGGSDPAGDTLKALRALKRLPENFCSPTVVIGKNNPHRAAIEALAGSIAGSRCLTDVPDMGRLMIENDLYLGAGGTTTWERCCLGLPGLVIAIAQNQIALSENLARDGYSIYLGEAKCVSEEEIAGALDFLFAQPWLREHISRRSRELVDGRGTARVAERILPRKITLRAATAADSNDIFDWRNAESTRKHFFDPSPISRANHDQWIAKTLSSPTRALLIGEREGRPVGVLRFDFEGDTAKVSIYLTPEKHPPGEGTALLLAGEAWLKSNHPGARFAVAEVLRENIASTKAFEKAGYQMTHSVFRLSLEDPR